MSLSSLPSGINFSKKPSSLIWASPICPLRRLVISSSFLTLIFFFSSIKFLLISRAFLSSSSCFLFSIINLKSLAMFSGALILVLMTVAWECTLLFLTIDSSRFASAFCLYSSENSSCSSLVTSNRFASSSYSFLLPTLWLLSLR